MKTIKNILFLTMIIILSTSLISCSSKENDKKTELTISAAASLKESMAEIKTKFEEENPEITLTFNFGSSGSLQKQIEQGAPSDIFISAGQSQMTALDNEGLILNSSRKDLVKNELVLIAPKNSSLSNLSELTNNTSIMHIAVGEPSSVPAGKYADEVMTNLGIKDELNQKLVFAKDVKEVLSWVVSGNAEAGFVYKSDSINVDTIKVAEVIPESYHSPITYPVGIVKESKNIENAQLFEDFLFNDTSKNIFEKYGYSVI